MNTSQQHIPHAHLECSIHAVYKDTKDQIHHIPECFSSLYLFQGTTHSPEVCLELALGGVKELLQRQALHSMNHLV
jgi:hypothetical protein